MCLVIFRVYKAHLEMVKVTCWCWIFWWNCEVATRI